MISSRVDFDDIPDAADVDPYLTTLAQPRDTTRTLAAQLLLESIGGRFRGSPREIVLSSHRFVRRSCRAGLVESTPQPWIVIQATTEQPPPKELRHHPWGS